MASQTLISTLVDWATTHGAKLDPSVEVYDDALTGLSFRVKSSAQTCTTPFAPIVTIPTALTLSYLDALSDKGPNPFPSQFLAKTPPHVVGRLFFIKEYLKGEESFWWPYIQALPQPDDRNSWVLPAFWSPQEADLLDGTNVEVGMEKIRRDARHELERAEATMEACGAHEAITKCISKPLYLWAYCIFSSRSFRPSLVLSPSQQENLPNGASMDTFSVLLPLFDIGNHDMTTPIRWDLSHDGQSCELRVGKAYAPGEQIFNNYSMKTNAELLLGYGFMLPVTDALHNDYTHVRKRADTPSASEEYLISLRPIHHPSSVLARSKQTLHLPPSTRVLATFQHVQADMVWDIFCTLTQPAQREELMPRQASDDDETAEKRQQERLFSGNVAGECKAYLEQTAAVIQHKVLQELERLEETDVVVDPKKLSENQKLALEYRERCRMVLEGTLEAMGEDEIFKDEGDA